MTAMITRQEVEQYWSSLKPAIRRQWNVLGDEELQEARHSAGRLVGLIQQRTGAPREEIEIQLEQLVNRAAGGVRRARAAIATHPGPSLAAALGIGFVAGLLISHLLIDSDEPAPRRFAADFGRRLRESATQLLPEAVQRRLS